MSIESGTLSPMALPNVSSQQLPDKSDMASQVSASSASLSLNASQKSAASVQPPAPDAEKLQAVVEKMNELMQNTNRSVKFSVDDSSERVVVKVMDLETDEVIRQIPSEETLKFSEFLEGMVGIIFDQKA